MLSVSRCHAIATHSAPCAFHLCSTFNISALGQQNVVLEQQNIYFAILAKIGHRSTVKCSSLESASCRDFRCAKVRRNRTRLAAPGSIEISAAQHLVFEVELVSSAEVCIARRAGARGPIGQSEQKQKRSVCLFLLTFSHFFPLVAAAAEKQHREEEQNQRAAATKSSLWKSPSIVAGGRENRKALPVWKVWFGAFLFRFVVIVLGVCGTE